MTITFYIFKYLFQYIPFITQLKFESNGDLRIFNLSIGVFTQEESLDIPVLGRDVMNFFTLLCDVKANLVWLIDEADRMKLLRFCDAIERNKIPLINRRTRTIY